MFSQSLALNPCESKREAKANHNSVQQVTHIHYSTDNIEQNVIILHISMLYSKVDLTFQFCGDVMS